MRTMAAVLVLAAGSRACLAQDLFGVTVTDTGGGNVPTLSVRGSSLPDLLEELVDTSGQFSAFNGTSLSASVLYAGVTDAMTVTVNNTGSVATLQFTVLGSGSQVFTFDEANGNLEEQVTDFLLKEAPSVLKDFFREINRRSLVSVTDGNPMASTARATRYTFDRFVMRQRGEGAASPGMPQPTEDMPSRRAVSVWLSGGVSRITYAPASDKARCSACVSSGASANRMTATDVRISTETCSMPAVFWRTASMRRAHDPQRMPSMRYVRTVIGYGS